METKNADLMKMARESLKGKWGLAIGTFVVYMLIIGAVQFVPIIGPISLLVITGPFALGLTIFSLQLSRNQEPRLEHIFQGFNNFATSLGTYLLMVLFIILWMLLLIVPGIIAAISYSMTFFILADDSSIGPMDALDKSKQMMNGFKWKFFCLGLRFIGWALLCILTLGIGFLWFFPYMYVSMAKFYDDVKANQVVSPYNK
jgi:uncharacterized membrane protein